MAGGYECTALLGRLDYHDGPGEAGNDSVPGGEAPGEGRLAEVVLGDQGSVTPDRLEEAPVAPRVDDVDAAPEDADRHATGRDRTLVGRGVDPEREPTHHAHAPLREREPERPGGLDAGSGSFPRAYQGDRDRLRDRTVHEEGGRRVGYAPQLVRVSLVDRRERLEPFRRETVL